MTNNLLKKIYYRLRYIAEAYIFGTRIQEWIWKTRRIPKNSSCQTKYYVPIDHPHRQLLVEKISAHAPLENVLEVGCNTGSNLYLLAKKFPGANVYGIDINPCIVKKSRTWLNQVGIKNVSLFVEKADRLNQFHNKNMDIVFTDSTLMYIGPDKIDNVIREMKRIARKAIIFSEWHFENNSKNYFWLYGHWIYNYRILLAKYFSSDSIKIFKVPQDFWDNINWKKFGSIIEVKL